VWGRYWVFAFASVGSGRWKAERFRSGAYRGTEEVAKRQSRLPTEAGASAPFTTRDERVRREASRAGAKSAQAGRGPEHQLVPVVGRCVLERFCSVKLPKVAPFGSRPMGTSRLARYSSVGILCTGRFQRCGCRVSSATRARTSKLPYPDTTGCDVTRDYLASVFIIFRTHAGKSSLSS
jgi:hypothetical protein